VAHLLERILPLMLAAASNPAVVGIVVLLLASTQRPLARAAAFVAGFGAVLGAVCIFGLVVFKAGRETFGPHGALFAWLDIVLGFGMLGLAVVTWMRRGSPSDQSRLLESRGPAAFFALGGVFMITDASALIALVPLLREVAVAHVSALERGIAVMITFAVVISPIAAPLAICALAPRSSERVLGVLRRGIDRYGYLVAIAVLAAIGLYLVVRGFHRL
jgi:hypothetical protein